MASQEKDTNAFSSSKGNGDNMYDGLSSPTFETAIPASEDTPILDPVDEERQKEEWRDELAKVESEIVTLRQVLGAKVRYATDLKRKLGISPLVEFKQDFQHGIKEIKSSDVYVKTNEKFHQINDSITQSTAYQKTSAAAKAAATKTNTALSSFGGAVSRRLGDIRNSRTFKSMEERVGDTYNTVKSSRSVENLKERLAKVSGSKSTDSFEDALRSQQENTDNSRQEVSDPVQIQPLPEEKVPL